MQFSELFMIEGGMRARKAAEILDRSESTVSRFLKRYQETGNIENKHRSKQWA
jgi:transposase